MLVEFNPAEGFQEYVFPEIAVVPIVAEVVVQFKFLTGPASAVGRVVFTFTKTVEVAVHPFEPVTVTV